MGACGFGRNWLQHELAGRDGGTASVLMDVQRSADSSRALRTSSSPEALSQQKGPARQITGWNRIPPGFLAAEKRTFRVVCSLLEA